jgi:endothelin-converting enzyme/putative endopeptidase
MKNAQILMMVSFLSLFPTLTGFAGAAPSVQPILDESILDKKVDPCTDFYKYSCGGWLTQFQLPSDKASYWRQGNVLTDHLEEQLKGLLEGLAKKDSTSAGTPFAGALGNFYASCMNESKANKAGAKLLGELLKTLDDPKLNEKGTLSSRLARLHLLGSTGFFEFSNGQDLKDSSQMIAFLDRGGMSLPDRDYYLQDDAKSKEVRLKYKEHIARSLKLEGVNSARAKAASEFILKFETELAKHSLPKDDRRDVQKQFHPMTYAEVTKLVPSFDWDTYIAELGLTQPPAKFNVNEPEFLKALNDLLPTLKKEDLANYLKYKLIHRSAYYVGGPLQTEDFKFWRVYLNGQKELPPRWKYCTQIVSGEMGEALGQAYVASIIGSQDIREKTKEMLAEIKKAFRDNLENLSWMDTATREAAKKKLDKMASKVGWPEKWRDYSLLKIDRNDFFQNELSAEQFENKRSLAKIGKPTDRTEWDMLTWEPNAYYNDSNNEMVLPLGELVPPVFDPKFSEGANDGSLGGGTIGHELTHGFDDSGKDMDADGNFVTWWTPESKAKFDQKSACFIKQTESYDIIPGSTLRIRGKATLGENLADNGGVKLALMALKKSMKSRPAAAPVLGMNELQQFFLAYAQGWCIKSTDEKLREQLLGDFHPPAEFRVNAVISNQPEFAEAFGCKAGSKMVPAERCAIW